MCYCTANTDQQRTHTHCPTCDEPVLPRDRTCNTCQAPVPLVTQANLLLMEGAA